MRKAWLPFVFFSTLIALAGFQDDPQATQQSEPTAGQQEQPRARDEALYRIQINQTVPLDRDLLNSYISISDRQGIAIPGISKDQVRVFQDGIELAKEDFTFSLVGGEDQWASIVLAIDVSGSMREEIEEARAAAADFAERVGVRDRLALLTFDEEIELELDFTVSREDFFAALDGIELRRNTALYDAVVAPLEAVQRQ